MLRFLLVASLVGLAALAHSSHAQTLTGRVTDLQTGQPLPGATVFSPQLDTGAATDVDGRYTLALPSPGVYRVVVSFVGYTPRTEAVTVTDGITQYAVALTEAVVETPAITVTARSQASDILSTPQSVAVIDARQLQREATGSPMDALEDVAGVRLLRTGPAIAKPVVRGLTAQRVLVVNDGVRQEGQGWGDEHGPEIGGADVDGIEVVRGPASLLYGSDALGGVVQTVQQSLFDLGPFGGEAQATAVSVAQQTAGQLRIGGASGAWGAEARIGGLRAGQVRTPEALIPNTAQEQLTLSARAGRRFGETASVTAEVGRFDQQLGLFEPDETGDLGRFEIATPFQRVTHDRAVLRAETRLASGDRLDVIGAVQQNRRREFEDASGDPALSLRLTTGTLDARFHHRPIGRVFGTVGASGFVQTNETLAEETLIPAGTTLNGALYVAEQLVLSRLTLDAGLRFDARGLDVDDAPDLGVTAQTRSYTALTGAAGRGLPAEPPTLSFALNLGRAFRAPVLQELFGNGVHEGTLRFERGDADLSPEASLALDGTVRYLTSHVFFEAGAFVNTHPGLHLPAGLWRDGCRERLPDLRLHPDRRASLGRRGEAGRAPARAPRSRRPPPGRLHARRQPRRRRAAPVRPARAAGDARRVPRRPDRPGLRRRAPLRPHVRGLANAARAPRRDPDRRLHDVGRQRQCGLRPERRHAHARPRGGQPDGRRVRGPAQPVPPVRASRRRAGASASASAWRSRPRTSRRRQRLRALAGPLAPRSAGSTRRCRAAPARPPRPCRGRRPPLRRAG